MKSYIKYIIVAVAVITVFIIVLTSSRQKENDQNNNEPTTVETTTTKVTVSNNDNENGDKETAEVNIETVYHENVGIDKLIVGYNEIADIKINPEMVNKGAYSVNANITVDDISIIIYNTENSISIDYSYEGSNDKAVYPVFRDFSKVLKPALKNKRIKRAWKEIKEGNYTNTSFYNLKGIEVTYITGEVDEETSHYLIRTKFNKSE